MQIGLCGKITIKMANSVEPDEPSYLDLHYLLMCMFGLQDESLNLVQSNLNGSNILGTMKICSRYGLFEPVWVNHAVRPRSNWRF